MGQVIFFPAAAASKRVNSGYELGNAWINSEFWLLALSERTGLDSCRAWMMLDSSSGSLRRWNTSQNVPKASFSGKTVGINPSRQRAELEGTSSTDMEPHAQVSSLNQTFSKAKASPGWIFSFERWFIGIKTGKEKMLSVICFPRVERRNPAPSQGKHLDDSAEKMGFFCSTVNTLPFKMVTESLWQFLGVFGSWSRNPGMSGVLATPILQIQGISHLQDFLKTPKAKSWCAPAGQSRTRRAEGQGRTTRAPPQHCHKDTTAGKDTTHLKYFQHNLFGKINPSKLQVLPDKQTHTPKIAITGLFLILSKKRHPGWFNGLSH